jgi:predicted DNA-binding antitoxin AbrB/MazE fold protein
MKTIHAVYENGVFHPKEPVELAKHTEVEFEPKVAPDSASDRRSAMTGTFERRASKHS